MNLTLQDINKIYRNVPVLNNISLTFRAGEIVSLLGLNGAGKTTLMRIISSIAAPTSGSVLIDGKPLARNQLDLRQRMYFLPDFPTLFAECNVLRNIALVLSAYGKDGAEHEEQIVEMMRDFDMLSLALCDVSTLSRGQAYKVALISLIVADPELWLLDEPFASGMDPHALSCFKRHAQAAAARGRTVIYSTQILDVVERFADRVCVIDRGKVYAFDTLANIRESAADKQNALQDMFSRMREEAQAPA